MPLSIEAMFYSMLSAVIPGRRLAPDPESRVEHSSFAALDSEFAPTARRRRA
jgi:hypothetical protein